MTAHIPLGRLERVALPQLGIKGVEARVDTGALVSALHAEEIQEFKRQGARWVRFITRVGRKANAPAKLVEAQVLKKKKVKSSNGISSSRYLIITDLIIDTHRWPIIISLADRSAMRYRMLLGRQAMGAWCTVAPSAVHLQGHPNWQHHTFLTECLYDKGYAD